MNRIRLGFTAQLHDTVDRSGIDDATNMSLTDATWSAIEETMAELARRVDQLGLRVVLGVDWTSDPIDVPGGRAPVPR